MHKSPMRAISRLNIANQKGFTLIDTVIAMAIVAILVMVAAPSWTQFVRNSRMTGATNDFIGAINLARVETIKRGARVMLCRSNTSTAAAPASPACGGTANTWSEGWLVYAITNGDPKRVYASANDILLDIGPALTDTKIMSTSADGNAWLAFNTDGSLDENANVTYEICGANGAAVGREVTITLVGRPNISNSNVNCP